VIAVDTNLIVRLVVMDDNHQLQMARDVFEAQPIFIAAIALLETIWVLTRKYGYPRDVVLQSLDAVFALGTVTLENEPLTRWALDRFARGADLGDMLLLVAAREQDGFVTFDTGIARRAGPQSPVTVRTLI
jgi:predicted nucleic-acid-binding protein